MPDAVSVEVVFALPESQALVAVALPRGATVADAIRDSGLQERYPQHDFTTLDVGIWGRRVARDRRLEDGDRVELYRPLQRDPREARRALARLGLTMGRPGDSD